MGNTESIHLRNFFTLTTYKDVGRTHKLNHSRHCVVDYYAAADDGGDDGDDSDVHDDAYNHVMFSN